MYENSSTLSKQFGRMQGVIIIQQEAELISGAKTVEQITSSFHCKTISHQDI